MKKRFFKISKILIISLLAFVILSLIALFGSNMIISNYAKPYIYNDTSTIPSNKVGILLGTSKYLGNGTENLYFTYRIKAAADLYLAGKIQIIIISGDNSTHNYNEPKLMKKELIKKGVPANKIILDYAGFRTFDSMLRARDVFGQWNFTVISQEFHNQRAVYIARHRGINAIAFNAKDVSAYYGFKTLLREKFARVKVFVDMLIGTSPKFLGEKIDVDKIASDTIQTDSLVTDTLK